MQTPMYVKLAQLRANPPSANLIVETDGKLYRVYSEKHHGACVTADSLEGALARIDGEINALWGWAKGKPFDLTYEHRIVARHDVAYPLDGLRSEIVFEIEQGRFHALTYRIMKEMAVRSALAMTELLDSIPDAGAALDGNPLMLALGTAAEVRRIVYVSTGAFVRKIGIEYENTGDIYANRMFALAAAETEKFMRNLPHIEDGETWTYRKVLRRLIWQDRVLARALYDAAREKWGDRVANPYGF